MNPQYTHPTPDGTQTLQASDEQPTDRDRKKVVIVGAGLATIAILSILFNVFNFSNFLVSGPTRVAAITEVILYGVQLVLAIGLLKYNRIAYHAFNIVAAIQILIGGFSVLSTFISFFLTAIAVAASPLGIFLLLIALLQVAMIGFYVYGIIVLHPKRVRSLFH